jgi:hypothetical protein
MTRARHFAAVWILGALAAGCADRDTPLSAPADASFEDGGAAIADGGGADAGRPARDGGTRLDGGGDDAGTPFDGGTDPDAGGGDDGGGSQDGGAAVADGGPSQDGGILIPDAGDVPCETGGVSRDVDPNDRPSQAQRVSPGTAVRGKLTPETDEDWYVVYACGKSLLDIGFTLTGPAVPRVDGGSPFGTPVDPRVDVLAADGTTLLNWAQNRSGAAGATNLRVVALAEAAGPIFLRVTDIGGDGRADQDEYTLTIATLPIPDADLEPDGNKGPALSARLAHPLSEGVLSQAFLASTRDEDWYRIRVGGLSRVDVVVTDAPATGTPLSYRVRLLGPDGVTEYARANARPPGSSASVNLRLRAQVPAAGDYHAVVSDQGEANDTTRAYRIFYTLGSVPDSAIEPNDVPAAATALSLGAPVSGHIAAPADDDWFKVDITSPSVLRAELTVPTGLRTPVDYRVTVLAPDATTVLAEATDFDGQFGDVQVIAAGFAAGGASPYFVRVQDWRADDFDLTQPYRLVVTTQPVPDAATEPNDTPPTAVVVNVVPGTPAIRTAYIATQRDVDFYAVDITAGQTISASLTAAVTPVQYRLSIRDRQGNARIADALDGNGRSLPNDLAVSAPVAGPTPMPLEAGRYYITVEDLANDDFDPSVPYTLTILVGGP